MTRTLLAEASIGSIKRTVFLLMMAGATGPALWAQDAAETDYFLAVADFFSLPATEVTILSDWELPPDEIPVVLFVARRAGVSPEALVVLRSTGQSWTELTRRYRVSAAALHVPVRDDASAGALRAAYDRFRSMDVSDWDGLDLSDPLIVGLVNVRMIAESLDLPAEHVLAETSPGATYVSLFARLSR